MYKERISVAYVIGKAKILLLVVLCVLKAGTVDDCVRRPQRPKI